VIQPGTESGRLQGVTLQRRLAPGDAEIGVRQTNPNGSQRETPRKGRLSQVCRATPRRGGRRNVAKPVGVLCRRPVPTAGSTNAGGRVNCPCGTRPTSPDFRHWKLTTGAWKLAVQSCDENSSESSPQSFTDRSFKGLFESSFKRSLECSGQSSAHCSSHRSRQSSRHHFRHRSAQSSAQSSRQSFSDGSTQSSLQRLLRGSLEGQLEGCPGGDPYPWIPDSRLSLNLLTIQALGCLIGTGTRKTAFSCIGTPPAPRPLGQQKETRHRFFVGGLVADGDCRTECQ